MDWILRQDPVEVGTIRSLMIQRRRADEAKKRHRSRQAGIPAMTGPNEV
jgi:hypothetical protein